MSKWHSEDRPKAIPLADGDIATLQPDGSYKDSHGTVYADITIEQGYAGLEGIFQTGKGDPFWRAAKLHDKAFSRAKLGYQDSTADNLETLKNFTIDIGTGMLTGAYMLIAGIPYILIGGVGGFIKQQITKKKN